MSKLTKLDCKPVKDRAGWDGALMAPVALVRRRVKAATIVLDMGEASREQGFRENGCR